MPIPMKGVLTAMFTSLLILTVTTCSAPADPGSSNGRGQENRGREQWSNGGWNDWNPETWARKVQDFLNPVIDGLWSIDRMLTASGRGQTAVEDILGNAASDPEPAPVEATVQETPYRLTAPGVGKVFFDTPEGPSVCSGTVVRDPARPGRSNLVWTAGHCVHAGRQGGWYRNIVFVPSFNDNGAPASSLNVPAPTRSSRPLPLGTWWADWAQTSQQWIDTGTTQGGTGAPFDFAVVHVTPPPGTTRSLEESVGSAVPVDFDAPPASSRLFVTAFGYPAAPPFSGSLIFRCQDRSGRLSIRADEPTMYRIGCTMTGGSSGGGWLVANARGEAVLVSNTSIGPAKTGWLAGPRLGPEAMAVYQAVSDRFSKASGPAASAPGRP